MAKMSISIGSKSGLAYFPKQIRQDGFVGRVEGIPNAFTITLYKPGTKPEDIERSLKIILQDIKLRRMAEENKITEE